MHRASILLQMHGAALGLWPFLPRKAVAIHVVPYPYGDNVQKWGRRMVRVGGRVGQLGGYMLVEGQREPSMAMSTVAGLHQQPDGATPPLLPHQAPSKLRR